MWGRCGGSLDAGPGHGWCHPTDTSAPAVAGQCAHSGFHVQRWCRPPSCRAVPAWRTLPSLSGQSGANHRGLPGQGTTLTPNLIAVSLFWGKEENCSPSGSADLPWGGPVDTGWAGKGREAELKVPTRQRMTRIHSLRGKMERQVAEPVEEPTAGGTVVLKHLDRRRKGAGDSLHHVANRTSTAA